MKITWQSSFAQVLEAARLSDKPWLVDAFWEIDASQALEGRQIRELPMQELVDRGMIQGRDSVVSGFNFLLEEARRGKILYDIWSDAERDGVPGRERTGLFAFPVPGAKRFLLIIPGGGYFNVCSFIEGFPFAEYCKKHGIASFILQYRASAYAAYPNPQEDAARAVRFILENREQFGLEGTDYAVLGFSAGGHLAASFGTRTMGYARFGVPKPQTEILGYPVITMSDLTHEGTRENLLREQKDDENMRKACSVEEQVTADYPPTYVWNCANDNAVPHENSDLLEKALRKHGVVVCHEVMPGDVHGWGLGDGTPAEGWFDRAIRFWNENS